MLYSFKCDVYWNKLLFSCLKMLIDNISSLLLQQSTIAFSLHCWTVGVSLTMLSSLWSTARANMSGFGIYILWGPTHIKTAGICRTLRWLKIILVEHLFVLNIDSLNILQRSSFIARAYFSSYLSACPATWVGSVGLLIRWATSLNFWVLWRAGVTHYYCFRFFHIAVYLSRGTTSACENSC